MKSVFDLCFINGHPYLLNRIRSPAEHLIFNDSSTPLNYVYPMP
jgi:hypothetical protein